MIIFTGWGMPNIGHFFLALDTVPRLVIPMCLVSDALLAQLHALCEREHFVDLLSPVIRA
ncbi:hypothetical protein QYS46_22280 [Klebsiella michiganensis]|nr:hypothetical protein [Klebsiella michiganensis]